MKKTSILLSLLAIFAAVMSCTPTDNGGQKAALTAFLSASESFTDGKAALTVTLSDKASSDVTVTLAVVETSSDAIKSSDLSFDNKITVAANTGSASSQIQLVK